MKCKVCDLPVDARGMGYQPSVHSVTPDDCFTAHNARYQDLVDAIAQMKRDAADAAIKLYQYAPGYFPASPSESPRLYDEGDDEAPFFSETYQYNLMGKEEGRVVLALVHNLLQAAGFDSYDIHALEEKAARANEKRGKLHSD